MIPKKPHSQRMKTEASSLEQGLLVRNVIYKYNLRCCCLSFRCCYCMSLLGWDWGRLNPMTKEGSNLPLFPSYRLTPVADLVG